MGCSCGSVCSARTIAVLGIIFSGLVIAGPTVIYFMERDYSELLFFLKPLHRMLDEKYNERVLTQATLADLRQLLNDFSEHSGFGALVAVSVAGANILLDLFLLIGTCCRVRCLMLPWLIVSLLEIIILGCPCVIFFSLLGTYLLVKGLLIPAICSFSAPSMLVLISMLLWLVVLVAYWRLGHQHQHQDDDCRDNESVQPLMAGEPQSCQPHTSTAYNLGQYPQYYPPSNNQGSSGPSAPPQISPSDRNNPHLYPTLPA